MLLTKKKNKPHFAIKIIYNDKDGIYDFNFQNENIHFRQILQNKMWHKHLTNDCVCVHFVQSTGNKLSVRNCQKGKRKKKIISHLIERRNIHRFTIIQTRSYTQNQPFVNKTTKNQKWRWFQVLLFFFFISSFHWMCVGGRFRVWQAS